MLRKQKRLAKLLGIYMDDESEFVALYEKKLNEGLNFEVPLDSIKIFNNYLKSFYQHFNILTEKHSLRGTLDKPYLANDEVYELNFMLSPTSPVAIKLLMDFSYQMIDLEITLENIPFWTQVLKQKKMIMQVKRIKSGTILPSIFHKEQLLVNENLYADTLKKNILLQINYCKNTRLVSHRLELWGYSKVLQSETSSYLSKLTPEDFGIKDLILLRKVWHDFSLNSTNNQLINEPDIELNTYIQKINKTIYALDLGQSLPFALLPI